MTQKKIVRSSQVLLATTHHNLVKWQAGLDGSARVKGIVPAGFESYLRILHKAHGTSVPGPGTEPEPQVTWTEVASSRGLKLEPGTIWADLSGVYGEPSVVSGVGTVFPPEEGRLDSRGFSALADVLVASTAGGFLAAFWTGWEPLQEDRSSGQAIRKGQTVSIQGNQYLLYNFTSSDLAEAGFMARPQFGWTAGNGITPSYLWPRDETWFLATNLDLDSSILAGPSHLVAKVEALPVLESIPVHISTVLTSSFRQAD
ncbi:hypothetical protein GCM10027038_09300 [Arthrobacter bambusae]